MISLDTGDSNVYSVFRNSRYTVNFVCVVSFYRATVYLQDNSAPLFLKAIEYAVRVFQYLSGNPVREIVSDMFSTYMDTRLIANFRDDKGIILSVMPPYMHWMNHIAEDMIHRNTISTRVRLPGLRGKIVKGRPIDDPSVYHPFATEHSNQCHNHSPYFPLQKRFGFPQTPFQCINRDRATAPVEMHPFGTVAYMFIEPRYRTHRQSDVAERCYHLCNGAFNYFVHPGVDVPRANVLLRTNGQVVLSGKTVYPYLKLPDDLAVNDAMLNEGGDSAYNPVALDDNMFPSLPPHDPSREHAITDSVPVTLNPAEAPSITRHPVVPPPIRAQVDPVSRLVGLGHQAAVAAASPARPRPSSGASTPGDRSVAPDVPAPNTADPAGGASSTLPRLVLPLPRRALRI